MSLIRNSLVLLFVSVYITVAGQSAFDPEHFFLTDKPLVVKLTTDMNSLVNKKDGELTQKAIFSYTLPDNSVLQEDITLTVRGHMRRSICDIPPVKLKFKNSGSASLSSLKNLKLVSVCRGGNIDVQLLLKEFLIYKMFNLLTDKSFRVRQVNLTYEDTKNKKRQTVEEAFFLENIDAMAKRNKCREFDMTKVNSELTDRNQMTLVNLFEFMIGNTDWSIPNNHNIKMIKSRKDSLARPFVVPYDFDYSGLVNADYAIPDPMLNIESVSIRVYRGFPRSKEELQIAIDNFNKQKDNIYSLIRNFQPLSARSKTDMITYLDEFYKIINKPSDVKYYFIDNARMR